MLCAVGCLTVLLFCGYQLYGYWEQTAQSKAVYDGLAQYTVVADEPEPNIAQTAEQSEIAWPEVDFDALAAVNPDVIGWLYCADTVIDYPIVQSTDNSFYLDHLFDRSENPNGCLFADFRCASDFSDRHTIIYGHAMKNGSMFSSIRDYEAQDYYDTHSEMLLLTPEVRYVIALFSGYVTSVQDNTWQLTFEDEAAFAEWLDAVKQRSSFASDVQPTAQDRIVTLSTCSYVFENARFVVHGILKCIPD